MDQQLARLRELSFQYTMPLVKKRLSDFLVDEIVEANENFKGIDVLSRDANTDGDIKLIREFLKTNAATLRKDLVDYCKEELREMADDLKWSRSGQGLAVMRLEEWVVQARKSLQADASFKTVFIGRDIFDPLKIVVSGVVEDDAQEQHVKISVTKLKPESAIRYVLERPVKT